MGDLLGQLGVDWKLLISQGVNFLVVLTILTVLVYKPLLKMMKERQEKIEFGLQGADFAKRRLEAIEGERSITLNAANQEALAIVTGAEDQAKARSGELIANAEGKAENLIEEARRLTERRSQEEFEKLEAEAHHLIRAALAKTVALDPSKIDDKLIRDAVEMVKRTGKRV